MAHFLPSAMPSSYSLVKVSTKTRNTPIRATGIVCTLGIATEKLNVLIQMIEEGMTIALLNIAFDSFQFLTELIQNLRKAIEIVSEKRGYNVACGIALFTQGPEVRTGTVDFNIPIQLKQDNLIELTTIKNKRIAGTPECVYIDYPNITKVMKPGERLLIVDGNISLVVKEVQEKSLICKIMTPGALGSNKKVILVDTITDLPAITERDRIGIKFAIEQNLDMIFAAKIKSAEVVREIRGLLAEHEKNIKVVAEIESQEGFNNLEEIIAVSDGILLARNEVALDMPIGKSFSIQKSVLIRCNRAGKPIICSNCILKSMTLRRFSTVPETADVANAVLDGASHIMLSSPTAIGKDPVECVRVTTTMCHKAEAMLRNSNMYDLFIICQPPAIDAVHAIAIEAVLAAKNVDAAAIIAFSSCGSMAGLIGKYWPICPIFAVTRSLRGSKHSLLHRGVVPVWYEEKKLSDWMWDMNARTYYAMMVGRKLGAISVGDPVVVVSQWRDGGGFTNNLRIINALLDTDTYECVVNDPKKPLPVLPSFQSLR